MMPLKKTFSFPIRVFLLVLYSSQGLSLGPVRTDQDAYIVIENQPFTLRCSLPGKKDELQGLKFKWSGQDPNDKGELLDIAGKGDDGRIEEKKYPGNITSILSVPRPPNVTFVPNFLQYKCHVQGKTFNNLFQIRLVREKAVPKIDPFEDKIVAAGEKVTLSCRISYENDNFKIKYQLNLYWKRNGKTLANTSCNYEHGQKRSCTVAPSVTIGSFTDGGNYTCRWILKDEHNSITGSEIQAIRILAYLRGPKEKEVKDTAGSDVELHCDVIGFPITYEWKYDDDTKIVATNRIKFKQDRQNVLTIDNIEYGDRKKYICVGTVNDTDVKQVIILRVKDPLAPLWPFLGIVAEAIVVAAIIILSERFSCKNQAETDSSDQKTEVTEPDQPSISHT